MCLFHPRLHDWHNQCPSTLLPQVLSMGERTRFFIYICSKREKAIKSFHHPDLPTSNKHDSTSYTSVYMKRQDVFLYICSGRAFSPFTPAYPQLTWFHTFTLVCEKEKNVRSSLPSTHLLKIVNNAWSRWQTFYTWLQPCFSSSSLLFLVQSLFFFLLLFALSPCLIITLLHSKPIASNTYQNSALSRWICKRNSHMHTHPHPPMQTHTFIQLWQFQLHVLCNSVCSCVCMCGCVCCHTYILVHT